MQQNLTAGTAPGPSVTVDPSTNRINSAGYAYDAAGNMTNDAANTYSYDAENRITSVNSGLATYSYLGALRVKRQFGGTTVYVYSGTQPIAEYVGGSLTKEYIYAGSQLLATFDASTGATTYQYHDHLSTRVEADASGCVLRRWGHFPFGEQWYETLSPTQSDACTGATGKWKFTSYERGDASEGGLDYAQLRYYSSRLGRFMSQDPLGGSLDNPESLDGYAYVLSNPVNLTDSAGLDPFLGCLLDELGNCVAGTTFTFSLGGGGGNIDACSGNGFADYFCASTHGGTQELFSYIQNYGIEDPIKGKRGLDAISAMYAEYVKDAVCPYSSCPDFYKEVKRISTPLGLLRILEPLVFQPPLTPILIRGKLSVPRRHPPTVPR